MTTRDSQESGDRSVRKPDAPDGGQVAHSSLADDPVTSFARFSTTAGRMVARCIAHIRVEGLGALPTSGPLIIASNHVSNADALLIAAWFLPVLGRPVHWLAKQEALDWPLLGAFIAANGAFGIRRGAADIEAFRAAREVLDRGRVLGLFPEGTRSPTGALQKAKDGATLLAVRTGAPIVPVGIAGTDRFWPKGQLIFRPGASIVVRVGQPFELVAPARGADRHAAMRAATELLMSRIAGLLPPRQRGAYAGLAQAPTTEPPMPGTAGPAPVERAGGDGAEAAGVSTGPVR